MNRPLRVVVIDDQPLCRRGLAAAFATETDIDVVGEAGNADDAVSLARATTIDVATVDILMPRRSGISLTSELYEIQPSCRVLGVSVIDEPGLIADMFRARACGYILKSHAVQDIVDAVRLVAGGVRYLPSTVSSDAVDRELHATTHQPFQRLTKREREVFELMIRGCSVDDIATKLFISRRTAETHRHRIMHKLSAHSIAQMQRLSARHGGLDG